MADTALTNPNDYDEKKGLTTNPGGGDKDMEKCDLRLPDDSIEEEEPPKRDTWGGKLDFIMSSISYAVGMGNLWRFPYLCYRNGGGAFLLPYLIFVVLIGVPMMYIEFTLGQYGRQGIIKVWKFCPLLEGVGWGMFMLSFIAATYYNMLIGYCFYYIFASFTSVVPWGHCDSWYNTQECTTVEEMRIARHCELGNGTYFNNTCFNLNNTDPNTYFTIVNTTASLGKPISSSDEYFHKAMLDISAGFEDVGFPRWQILLCFLLVWIIVFIVLSRGIQSSGKVTYVTSLFPYVILSVLFVRGLTLEGASDGIMYYLMPEWHKLLNAKVWADAAIQVFFSLSVCWGGLITLASYNDFNNHAMRDAIVVSTGDTLTSIFGGIIIFSYIGHMASILQVDISQVVTQGAGLAFIVYPQAVLSLPLPQLWNILFMLVLVNVGLGTTFAFIQTISGTISDAFPKLQKGRYPLFLTGAVCMLLFALGIPNTTRGGMYFLQLLDGYVATYSSLIFAVVLLIAVAWIYGSDRISKNIEEMSGSAPSKFWIVMWKFITPLILLAILLFSFIYFTPATYGDYKYPLYCDLFGWGIVFVQFAAIPGVAIYKICRMDGSLSVAERIRRLSRPEESWNKSSAQLPEPMKSLKIDLNNDAKTPLKAEEPEA